MQTYDPQCGMTIGEAVRVLVSMAPATMTFNDTVVTAMPGMTQDQVLDAWRAEESRLFALPENVAARARAEAEYEERRAVAQSVIDRLVADLATLDLSDMHAAVRWLVAMQPRADLIGVKYDRAAVVRAFEGAGYVRGECTRREHEDEIMWRDRVGREGAIRWLIGQALDGIATVGAPHQVIHSFAERMGIA